jgi:chromosome segregation ATPase
MNQTSEPASNRSGRFLAGGLGLALVFGGVTSKINNDLTLQNNSLERNVAEKTNTIADKVRNILDLTGEKDQLVQDNKDLNHKVVVLGTDLTDRKLQIADLDKKLVATTATLEQTKTNLEASTTREKDLGGKLELAARREATLRADLTAGMERETGMKNTIASLEKARTDLNGALEMRGMELAETRKREEAIKTELSARLGDLKLGQERETMLKGEVLAGIQREQTLKTSVTGMEKEKADLAAAMKAKADEVAKLDKNVSEINKAFADAQATKDALLKTNESLGKEKLELITARETLQKQINELSEKIKALTDQNKGQLNSLQSLQSEKAVLAEQFKSVKTEIETLGRQRDALKGERDQFQGACTELMAKLQQLTEKVKGLEKDFISLNEIRSATEGFVTTPR